LKRPSFQDFPQKTWLEKLKGDLSGEMATTPTIRMAMPAMADPKVIASIVAKRLGVTTSTLYSYVNSDGSLKEAGAKTLGIA